MRAPPASIVIAAHDEERTIGRLLRQLTDPDGPTFEILVICNGCTDGTAAVARSFGSSVAVVEDPVPSKALAQRTGDRIAHSFPRVYIDADVEITAADVAGLVSCLDGGTLQACAPRRVVPMDGCSLLVRWYYAVWQELPQVRTGLFGRGVIAVREEGLSRLRALPMVMSDDLAMSEAFGPAEGTVVDAVEVVVHPPRTLGDLLRRRIRVVTGTTEIDRAGLRGQASTTTMSTLLHVGARNPRLLVPGIPAFLVITLYARLLASRATRRGDFSTWLRDESSRSQALPRSDPPDERGAQPAKPRATP